MSATRNSFDADDQPIIRIAVDEFVSNQNPLQGHTVPQARQFWRQFNLQDVVEEDVFIRGFLAFQHRENFPGSFFSWTKGTKKVHSHQDPAIRLEIGDHIYTHTEILSLKKSWTVHYFITAEEENSTRLGICTWILKQWKRFRQLDLALRQLSGPHKLLLVMCMFAAITQGMDQASMAGANISAPEALGVNIMHTAASHTTSRLDSMHNSLTVNTWRFGAINGACFLIGSVTGLLITDPLSERWRWGRCGTIFLAGIISFSTVMASASIHKWWQLLICRAFLGVGMAGKAAIVPILLSETSTKHMRGFLVMSWQLLDAFGIAAASLANIIVYHLNPAQSWRWMFVAAGIPALLLFSLVPFCQESPRWLLKRGDDRVKGALESLQALHGQPSPIVACGELYLLHTRLRHEQRELSFDTQNISLDVTQESETASNQESIGTSASHSKPHQIQGEQVQIEKDATTTNTGGSSKDEAGTQRQERTSIWQQNTQVAPIPSIIHFGTRKRWKLMRKPYMRRANYAAAAVMISQQLCGINLLGFLSSTFFRNSIFQDPDKANSGDNYKLLGLSLGFGLVNFLATFFAAPYIDVPKRGRRYLLSLSFPLMALFLMISGLILLAPPRDSSGRAQPVVIAFHYIFLIAFTIAYSIGEGPAAFVICSEVFQSVNRELGMSLAVFWNFMGAGLLALLAPALTKYEGQPYLLLGCTGTNLIAWLSCFILVPDTVNRELEDMVQRLRIPTKAATIFHLAWLWNQLSRPFGKEREEELDDIEEWYQGLVNANNGEQPQISWRFIVGKRST